MNSPLNEHIEYAASQIVDIAIKLHKILGPGLLESVYENCFCHELEKRGIPYTRQQNIEFYFEDLLVPQSLRMDIIVHDAIIIELKAQEIKHPIWEAQLLSYLILTRKRLGFLNNFHVPLMKNGIKRLIL